MNAARPSAGAIALVAALLLWAAPVGTGAPPAAGADSGLVLQASPDYGPVPLLVQFNLSVPAGPAPNLSWSFGDGSYLNGSGPGYLTPSHSYLSVGRFNATVVATWSTGNLSTWVEIVGIASNLTVAFSAQPSSGFAPLTVGFNSTTTGGEPPYSSFAWQFGNGSYGTGASVRYTYTTPGSYGVNLTVTDRSGHSASATRTIEVLSRSLRAAISSSPLRGPEPLTVNFTAVPSGGSLTYVAYDWTFGDGSSDSGPLVDHTFRSPGTFNVTLTVVDSASSRAVANVTADAQPAPFRVTVTFAPTNGTVPLRVGFEANATGGSLVYPRYNWTFGDGSSASGLWVNHTFESAGTFVVNLTARDSWNDVAFAQETIVAHAATPVRPTPSNRNVSTAAGPTLWPWVPVLGGAGGLAVALAWVALSRRRRRAAPTNDASLATPGPSIPGDPAMRDPVTGSSAEGPPATPPGHAINGPVTPSPTPVDPGPADFTSDATLGAATLSVAPAPGFASERQIALRLVRHLATLPYGSLSAPATPERTQAVIAERLDTTPGAVSKALRRLTAAGIVTHDTDHVAGKSRRVKVYRLTPRGERLGRALDPRPTAWDAEPNRSAATVDPVEPRAVLAGSGAGARRAQHARPSEFRTRRVVSPEVADPHED